MERCDAEAVVGADPGRTGRTFLCESGARQRRAAAEAGADRRRGRGLGDALPDQVPLQADGARRCDVGRDLQALPRLARQRSAVLHADRHRPLRRLQDQARRCDLRSGPDRAVRDLQPLRAARRRARRVCARPAAQGFRLQRRRELPVRPRKDAVGEERSRARRPLAQARQERLAAPEARRQDRQGHPRHARQALRELSRPRAPAQQRRRVPDVHERVRDGDRAAHQLSRPARAREFRHRDEAVARRHRRGAAAR